MRRAAADRYRVLIDLVVGGDSLLSEISSDNRIDCLNPIDSAVTKLIIWTGVAQVYSGVNQQCFGCRRQEFAASGVGCAVLLQHQSDDPCRGGRSHRGAALIFVGVRIIAGHDVITRRRDRRLNAAVVAWPPTAERGHRVVYRVRRS